MTDRAPLGVVPRKIWIEQRVTDLSRAISEHLEAGDFESVRRNGWVTELGELLAEHEKIVPGLSKK